MSRRMMDDARWQTTALGALHAGLEDYAVGLLEDSNLLALHAGRQTIMKKDVRLVRRLRGDTQ